MMTTPPKKYDDNFDDTRMTTATVFTTIITTTTSKTLITHSMTTKTATRVMILINFYIDAHYHDVYDFIDNDYYDRDDD